VQQPGELFQTLDEPRSRRRIQRRRHGVDRPVLDGGHRLPAWPRRHHLRRLGIERQIAIGQDDDLGVTFQDALRANLAGVGRQIAKNVGAASQVEQLTVETIRPRHERLVWRRGVELLVHPWSRCIGDRRHDRVSPGEHVRSEHGGNV
jgi:hypothetical protein